MKIFKNIADDLKNGQNVEIYLVFIISLFVLIFDIFGTIKIDRIIEAVLAILALLSFGTITTRRTLKSLNDSVQSLNEATKKLNESMVNENFVKFGINDVLKDSSQDYIVSKFIEANNEIRIFSTWLLGVDPTPALITAAKRGVDIKILLMDPKSQIIKQRLCDIGFSEDSKRPSVSLETLRSSFKRNNVLDKVKIQFYNALPPFTLFMADDWMLLGIYWKGTGAFFGPNFEILRKSSEVGSKIIETFDLLWDESVESDESTDNT